MRAKLPVIVVAVAALALRLAFLLGHGGPLAAPTDYDDGVYFSVSALLVRGVLPYRDFVFVHPPGVAWFYALVAWWPSAATAFAAARILACVVGAVNTLLVGLIVLRSGKTVPAVLAAALYALHPDAAGVEHSTYLEPVLNLFCLSAALLWLEKPQRAFTAGLLAGTACAVKLLGGIWVVAALVAGPRKQLPRFLLGGIVAGLVLLAPLALLAPSSFIAEVIRFQLGRPPDGTIGAALRLPLLYASAPAAAILCALGLLRWTREHRFFVTATALTGIAFLASSSYWTQYNSYLAASECVLAGLGAAVLGRFAVLALAGSLILTYPNAKQLIANTRQRSAESVALRNAKLPELPLFSFDPSWSLIADHLPPHGDGAPVIVDSYAAMLIQAGKAADTNAAFRNAPAQPAVRARLEKTPLLILGWRGNWQLPDADREWVKANFLCITPEAGELCVQRRLAQPLAALASDGVTFGDGWYGQEGDGAHAWRWMSSRGVITLPSRVMPSAVEAPPAGIGSLDSARDDTATLHLELYVPNEAQQATATLTLDGKPLDRIQANGGALIRRYELPGAAHTLVIATDKTFVPGPQDRRQLGLSLTRLVWLDARATPWRP